MRAAIYTRYSTDLQSQASTEDQRRLCEARAPDGARVVALHSDEGVSGASPVQQRPGGRALMADVLARRIDLVLVESLDRLSRDQVDLERTVRRIEHHGIRIVGVSDGYDSTAASRKVVRAVRGIVAELYLDDLRAKTHRGLAGKATAGLAATGPSYGYRIVRDDRGSRYEVDDSQAPVVREIFARYAAGESMRAIAFDLNRRRVPSPRGSTWAQTTLYGSPAKGSGILNNALYVGRLVWNRSQWVKDPDTGKRQRIDRPRHEWIETTDESLRLIDDATWHAVRQRIDPRTGTGRGRPASTLFGGMLRCPHCAGPVIAVDSRKYGCGRRKDRGPAVCPGFTVSRVAVDEQLVGIVRDVLSSEAVAVGFDRALRAELDDGSREAAAARLVQVEGEIGRLVDAIATVGASDAIVDRLRRAEDERRALRAQAAARPAAAVDAGEVLAALLAGLVDVLREEPGRARVELATMLEPVALAFDADGVLHADLRLLLGTPTNRVAGARYLICRQVRLCDARSAMPAQGQPSPTRTTTPRRRAAA